MKAQYYFNDCGDLDTAEVLFVRPRDGVFAGPLVKIRRTPNAPDHWRGFESFDWGIGQLVAPRTLVIHRLSHWNFDGCPREIAYRKFAVIRYKNGRVIRARLEGKRRGNVCEFFGKRQRVYIPHFSTPLATYRSPIRQDAPLGWEI